MKKVGKAIFSILLGLLIVAICAGALFGLQGYLLYRDAVEESSIADRVAEIESQAGYVPYEELPQFYIDAVVSVEDKRFFTHPGIDPWAICRAAWTDLRTLSFQEGGSTITQQLAKNLLFTQEKEISRKFAEVIAAFEIEEQYSKEEIFALYVNTAYFGSGYYGIGTAAEGYFGVSPENLTDYQCAMLAGLPNAPSAYSPDTAPDLAAQRTQWVLTRMVANDKLTEEEMEEILDAVG